MTKTFATDHGGGDSLWSRDCSGAPFLFPTNPGDIVCLDSCSVNPNDSQLSITAGGCGAIQLLNYGPGDQEIEFDTKWVGGTYISQATTTSSLQVGGCGYQFWSNDGQVIGTPTDLGPHPRFIIKPTGALQAPDYGSGTFTGTPTFNLSVDASGNIIETTGGGGMVIGDPVTGGNPNDILFIDGSGNLAQNDNFQFDGTTFTAPGLFIDIPNNIYGIGDPASTLTSNTGTNVTAFGSSAGAGNSGSTVNLIGVQAGQSNTGSSLNAIGIQSAFQNTGDSINAIGILSAYQNSGGNLNAVGYSAGYLNSGQDVNAIGYSTATSNTKDYLNALGYTAGANNTGLYVNAIGYLAGETNSGNNVDVMGANAGQYNTGSNVTGIGLNAANQNSGTGVNAIGYYAAQGNTRNSVNAMGNNAAQTNTGFDVNAMGDYAGYQNSGDYVVAVGDSTAYNNTGDNVIQLGRAISNIGNAHNNILLVGIDPLATADNQGQIGTEKDILDTKLHGDLQVHNLTVGNFAWSPITGTIGTSSDSKPMSGVYPNFVQVGYNQAFYSSDGGATWHAGSISSNQWASVAGIYPNYVALTGDGTTNAVAYSSDGGATWTDTTMPASRTWSSVAGEYPYFVAVSRESSVGSVSYSTDGGVNWTDGTISASDWSDVTGVYPDFVASSFSGAVAYSSDGGATFTDASVPPALFGISSIAGEYPKYVAVGTGDHASYSNDGGDTWTDVALPASLEWHEVVGVDPNYMALAGSFGSNQEGSAFSTDGGVTWRRLTISDHPWKGLAGEYPYFVASSYYGDITNIILYSGAVDAFGIVSTPRVDISSSIVIIHGATSGLVEFSEPFHGSTYKKVMIYVDNLFTGDTATYNFSSSFTHTPEILTTSGLSSALITSLDTSSVTVTGASSSGFLILEGY